MVGFAPFVDTTNDGQGGGLFAALDPDYQLRMQKVAQGNAFKDGLPTDANGNADFNAMAKALMQRGDFANGGALLTAGLQQRQMADASKLSAGMAGWMAPSSAPAPGDASTAAPSSAGANPQVVAYITSAAKARGISPNVALGAAGGEGLRGFDPNGKPNLGDGGSSAGPYQLHYGGVAPGGNAAAGLGDDFTAATGLDARDPSTWKAQVDFALDHAAKYGWSAFHGAGKVGIGQWTGIGQPLSQDASNLAPVQVAQNGANDATDDPPPSGTHPYAPAAPAARAPAQPGPDSALPGSVQTADAPIALTPRAPARPPGAPGQFSPIVGQPAAVSTAGPAARPAPMPTVMTTPPPPSPNAGALTSPGDPTYGGQVPDAWLRAGHSAADWVRYQRSMAGIAAANPFAKGQAEQWAKSAEDLQSSMTKQAELTSEQKNARDPLVVGQQQDIATIRARARVDAQTDNALVPVAQPDGSTTLMPKRVALEQAAAGKGPMQSLPGYVTSGQQALATKLNDGSAAYTERQVAGERLDALSDLLSTYQTGANSGAFNDAAAKLRSIGINVPNSAMVNPAAMQQFTKDAYANVLSSMKEQGNKQYAAEVQSAVNSNPNTELQPEANAAMVAQMKGIQQYHDANYRAYADWYNTNKGVSNDAVFQIGWAKANPLGPYVAAARKNIAPMGETLPPPNKLQDGQAYMVQGPSGPVKARWSAAASHFIPVNH